MVVSGRWIECGRRRCGCTAGTRWRLVNLHVVVVSPCHGVRFEEFQRQGLWTCVCARRLKRGFPRGCRRRWVDVWRRRCGGVLPNDILRQSSYLYVAAPRRIQYFLDVPPWYPRRGGANGHRGREFPRGCRWTFFRRRFCFAQTFLFSPNFSPI